MFHADFARPVEGLSILIVIDGHTKWLEVRQVAHPTWAVVSVYMRSLFAMLGVPRQMVSENRAPFVFEEI